MARRMVMEATPRIWAASAILYASRSCRLAVSLLVEGGFIGWVGDRGNGLHKIGCNGHFYGVWPGLCHGSTLPDRHRKVMRAE